MGKSLESQKDSINILKSFFVHSLKRYLIFECKIQLHINDTSYKRKYEKVLKDN